MTDLCVYLDWDSNFFHRRIARVVPNRLTPSQADEVLHWCEAERIDCLYFLADSDDAETVRAVEARAFALVDARVTLQWSGRETAAQSGIRPVQPSDVEALKAIARTSHRDARFYYDDHFTTAECDALYETWIERSCADFADAVLVAEREQQPVGYITCSLREQRGSIGLFGLNEAWRGKKIGTALINSALDWFHQQNASVVQVVTQGRNIPAQHIYQRCGFTTIQFQLWYHRWFEQSKEQP